jgi:hypothetical protein
MRSRSRVGPAIVLGLLAMASVAVLSRADATLAPTSPGEMLRRPLPEARRAASANGRSRGVRMRTALPGHRLELPLELSGAPHGLTYEWIPVGALRGPSLPRPLVGPLVAPGEPGFYRLAISRDDQQRVIDSVVVAVLKPMAEKRGVSINGYRIGFYRGERLGESEIPAGFLEVQKSEADLEVSDHLTLADFLTHDGQTTWPRYVALNPKLLDKLELVFEEIARWRGSADDASVDVNVTSGFRTPLHNRRVPRAASDSRHQYGDAADIAVDANGDGRLTSEDVHLVARAVEVVERRHPDLVGGLGSYTRLGAPYAHVDVRGTRVRWRG